MKIERYVFAIACALLQSAAPVSSNEVRSSQRAPEAEDVVALESDANEGKARAASFRGTASAIPRLRAISSKAKEEMALRDAEDPSTTRSSKTTKTSKSKTTKTTKSSASRDSNGQQKLRPHEAGQPSRAPNKLKPSGAPQKLKPTGPKKLTVHLDQATNVGGHDRFGATDAYVRIELYESSWRATDSKIGDGKSKVVESNNPTFDEDFVFDLPEGSTKDMVLKLKVFDKDVAFDDQIGEAEIELDELNLGSNPTDVVKDLEGDAKIYITLTIE